MQCVLRTTIHTYCTADVRTCVRIETKYIEYISYCTYIRYARIAPTDVRTACTWTDDGRTYIEEGKLPAVVITYLLLLYVRIYCTYLVVVYLLLNVRTYCPHCCSD